MSNYELTIGHGVTPVTKENFMDIELGRMSPILVYHKPTASVVGGQWAIYTEAVPVVFSGYDMEEISWGFGFGEFFEEINERFTYEGKLPELPDPEKVRSLLAGHPELASELREKLIRGLRHQRYSQIVSRMTDHLYGQLPKSFVEVRNLRPYPDKIGCFLYSGEKEALWMRLNVGLGTMVSPAALQHKQGNIYKAAFLDISYSFWEPDKEPEVKVCTEEVVLPEGFDPPDSALDEGTLERIRLDLEDIKEDLLNEPYPEVPEYTVDPEEPRKMGPGDQVRLPLVVELHKRAGTLRSTGELLQIYESRCKSLWSLGYSKISESSSRTGRTKDSKWVRPPIDKSEIEPYIRAWDPWLDAIDRVHIKEDEVVVYIKKPAAGRFIGRKGWRVRQMQMDVGRRIVVRS